MLIGTLLYSVLLYSSLLCLPYICYLGVSCSVCLAIHCTAPCACRCYMYRAMLNDLSFHRQPVLGSPVSYRGHRAFGTLLFL